MATVTRRGPAVATVWRVLVLGLAAVYFAGPALASFWFSIHNSATGVDFHAYTAFFSAPGFQPAFQQSLLLGVGTVVLTTILMVPTMLLAHLRYPGAKRWLEAACLLPLVVPPVALVVGVRDLITMSSSDALAQSPLPSVMNALQGNPPVLLALVYTVLALPFTYRALDAGLTGSAVPTLVEAARNLGAGWGRTLWLVVVPALRTAILNAALLAFALVLGEFTIAKILSFGTFPVWLSQFGSTDGQLQVGLSLLSLVTIWVLLLLIAAAAGPRSARRSGRPRRATTSSPKES
jgi:putative spermidine/putrescine transport system permease protein